MPIDWRDLLLTLAQITITIVGFSGIVGALGADARMDRSSDEYVLFRWMLDYSLGALLACLLPFLVFATGLDETTGWRVASASSIACWVVYFVFNRRFAAEMYKRSSPLDRAFHVGDPVALVVLILNVTGGLFSPGFVPFLVTVLWSLLGSVVGFARLLDATWGTRTP